MRRAIFVAVVSLLSGLALLHPVPAAAQQASVAGAVTDGSGAVLPGVVVEASSAALIEKTRSVVTDGTGQYRIVGLPSGTYTVTYTLTGFNIVKREGVELAGALIVTIDIQMRVGAIEESVVVTGESPVVDVQSARRQQIIAGPVLAALPTSRSYNSVLQLVPSVVAGDGNLQLRPTMLLFTAHGGSTQDGRLTVDGINTGSSRGGSGVSQMAGAGGPDHHRVGVTRPQLVRFLGELQAKRVVRALEIGEGILLGEGPLKNLARAQPHRPVDARKRFARVATKRMRVAEQSVRQREIGVELNRLRPESPEFRARLH
jgi:hypothetical protein